jgi:hypothetical protein
LILGSLFSVHLQIEGEGQIPPLLRGRNNEERDDDDDDG